MFFQDATCKTKITCKISALFDNLNFLNPRSQLSSHLIYACRTWRQSKAELFNRIQKLQDKALRIINFLPHKTPVNDIYKTSKILKLSVNIWLQNTLLVKNCFEKQLLQPLLNFWSTINQRVLPRKTLHLWRKLIANHMK